MNSAPSSRWPRPLPFLLAGALCVGLALAMGWSAGKFIERSAPANHSSATNHSSRGELLYQMHCASCHGQHGAGDGPAAATLRPPPRDFALRPWRFEITPDSIRKVIAGGIPGTAMPGSGAVLGTDDLDALVAHVLLLAKPSTARKAPTSEQAALLAACGFFDLQGTVPGRLELSDADGKAISISDFRGQLILINFWGTTCVHCRREMVNLRDLEAKFSGRAFKVVHVCADSEDAGEAQVLASEFAPGVRTMVDETGLGASRFDTQILPTFWLIGPDGLAIGRAHGARDWKSPELIKLIEQWLP